MGTRHLNIRWADAPKFVLWAFCIAATYLLLYELVFSIWSTSSFFLYKIGILATRICYSIVATSIFYFLSQYVPIYLPRQRRKRKILYGVFLKTEVINTRVEHLKFQLKVHGNDFYDGFNTKVAAINPTHPVAQFENWYEYLFHLKTNLTDTIRSMILYHDYLSLEFMDELNFIEYRLLSLYAFEGHRMLDCDDLSYAEIQLQQLFIHNRHLQELKEIEFAEYESEFKFEAETYRQKHYGKI